MAKLSRKNFSPRILPFVRKFLRPHLRKNFLSPERTFFRVNPFFLRRKINLQKNIHFANLHESTPYRLGMLKSEKHINIWQKDDNFLGGEYFFLYFCI